MREVNHHYSKKYLARRFSTFAYYHCHIQPTNISVYLLHLVCVCYLVHQRGFGFQRLTGISNQASGPHYSHGSGRVIKPLIILYLMCSCILSICGYKMVFNACLFSCTVCCTNGLSNTCVQMCLLVRLICLRLSLRD